MSWFEKRASKFQRSQGCQLVCCQFGVRSTMPPNDAAKRAERRRRAREHKRELEEADYQLQMKLASNSDLPSLEDDAPDVPQTSSKVEIEVADVNVDFSAPGFSDLQKAMEAFTKRTDVDVDTESNEQSSSNSNTATDAFGEERVSAEEASRRRAKMLARLSIAELKQLVLHPEVVEMHDCNSSDPRLLVWLKSLRNTVPVPKHWSQKRRYLQNKKGFEKLPYRLPTFIEDTGIARIRAALLEKDAKKTLKSKGRQRLRPTMGGMNIDYQTLHDAFFRYQTKPRMSGHGELYYENKEFEARFGDKRPGFYSPALRQALGMHSDLSPPPWLFAMQRFGPPAAYPTLRLPGVNAPIPVGARWGFSEGEWGKPPVDEQGKPLYGDVFGQERIEKEVRFASYRVHSPDSFLYRRACWITSDGV